VWQSNLTMV